MIFASKDQLNGGGGDGGLVTAESGITTNHIYSSQPIQDNIAAESEVAKRGAASVSSTSSASGSESQGQSSQIDVGKHFKHVISMQTFDTIDAIVINVYCSVSVIFGTCI